VITAIDSNVIRKGLACVFVFFRNCVLDKNHDKPAAVAGTQGEQKLLAAGGLNATEVNEGRSGAEWNPVPVCKDLV
jgi:hypothetical protein